MSARRCDVAAVERELEAGRSPTEFDVDGVSPLAHALAGGAQDPQFSCFGTAQLLVQSDADSSHLDLSDGGVAFWVALGQNNDSGRLIVDIPWVQNDLCRMPSVEVLHHNGAASPKDLVERQIFWSNPEVVHVLAVCDW